MSKVVRVTAEYDAGEKALRLVEPLEGVEDHETLTVDVTLKGSSDPERPWMAFEGVLSGEDGEEMAALINEMFPPWNE